MATATISDRRRAVAALAAERNGQGRAGRLWKRAFVALIVLGCLTLLVLWLLGFFSTPRAVAEIAALVDQQIVEYDRAARGEVPFNSGAAVGPMMQKMRDLPREQRKQVGQQMGRLWEARERAEMGSYFALTPDKRQAELDRRIKAEEDSRKAWQADRERREQQGGNNRTASAGGDRGRPPGPGGGGPGGGGPPGGRRGGGTEESANEWRKRRIDHTTPEQRARQSEYRRAVEERRKQLGLPPSRRG